MLELYHGEPNLFSLKPLIVLKEKNVEFVGHHVDPLKDATYENKFLPNDEVEMNMEGEGPILVHDGRVMTDSFFMSIYLDDVFSPMSLRPAGAVAHWRILAGTAGFGQLLGPAVSTLGVFRYLAPVLRARGPGSIAAVLAARGFQERREGWTALLAPEDPAELIEDSRRKVGLGIGKIEGILANSAWLAGDSYSLYDIDTFALTHCLTSLTPDLLNETTAPRMMNWLEQIRARPAVQAALAMSLTGKPEQAFLPGPEHSRWG
jgi:GST-like protein